MRQGLPSRCVGGLSIPHDLGGDLSGEIEIPQRWYLAIQNMLAHQMAMELPTVQGDRISYLEGQAEKYWNIAEQEERDKSPIYFAPNISYYTR